VVAETSVVGTEHTASWTVVPELTFITHNPGVNPNFDGVTRLAGTDGTI